MANFNEVVEMGGSLFQVNISYFQGGPLQKNKVQDLHFKCKIKTSKYNNTTGQPIIVGIFNICVRISNIFACISLSCGTVL